MKKAIGWIGACVLMALAVVVLAATPARAKDGQPTDTFRGILGSRPAGNTGAWVVGGRTFTADGNTQFDTLDGPLNVGACVKVRFFSGDLADEIDSEPAGDCASATASPSPSASPSASPSPSATPQLFEQRGIVNSRPDGSLGTWVVGGRAFAANANTEFNTSDGALAVGACAKVRFFSAGGMDTADEIDSEPPQDCGLSGTPAPSPSVTPSPTGTVTTNLHRGPIESRPLGLLGEWTIGGQTFVADNNTEFSFEDGALTVGSCAKVRFFSRNGANVADEIDAEPQRDCGSATPSPTGTPDSREDSKVFARIDAFPPTPFVGTWTIGGSDYQANSSTEFKQEDGAFAVGACIKAEFVPMNGVSTLTKIETENDYKCQGVAGEPANVFKSYGVVDTFTTTVPSTWVISGISYTVSSTTKLETEHGVFKVGSFVEMRYVVSGTVRAATKIETHVAPGAGDNRKLGRLDTRPSDDWGTWIINGETYQGDPAIRVELPQGAAMSAQAAHAGQKVFVNYYVNASGIKMLTLVRAKVATVNLPVLLR